MLEGVAQGRQHNGCHDDMRNDKMVVELHVPYHGTNLPRLSHYVARILRNDVFMRRTTSSYDMSSDMTAEIRHVP